MNPNIQKEQFSDAYLHAIAAVSECTCCKPPVDDDSVDWTLSKLIQGRPRLDVQLKCTASDPGGDILTFALKRKNYDDLRLTDLLVPRILIIVVVPEQTVGWLTCDEDELVLRHRAFWYSLRGMPETNNDTSVTIYIPRSQRINVGVLNQMMLTISTGGDL